MSPLIPASEFRAELQRSVNAAGGVVAWAQKRGLSHTVVSLVLNGHRQPPESLANALGYIAETAYRKVHA